jgi:membrane protein DedA with SNARE-associated domain
MQHFLTSWGYLALFVATFVSSMGIPVGSEIAMGYAGALASGHVVHPAPIALVPAILVALAGEVAGSGAGYAIGRFGGRPLVDKWGHFILLTHRDLDRAEAWFARRGDPFVFFGRLIPLLRSFVSFAAGLGEMAVAKFAIYTTLGCAVWCTALISIGYGLGASYEKVLKKFSYVGYAVAVIAVVVIAIALIHRIRVVRAERAERADAEAPAN